MTKKFTCGLSASRRRSLLWILIGAVGLLVLQGVGMLVVSTGLLGGAGDAVELAPDLTLQTLQGDFRLSEKRGEVVVLYFSSAG